MNVKLTGLHKFPKIKKINTIIMKVPLKLKQSLLVLILIILSLNLYYPKKTGFLLLEKNLVSNSTFQHNLKTRPILVEKDITVSNYFK